MKAVFLRAIEADDKAAALKAAIAEPRSPLRFEVNPASFRAVPRAPFAYWASKRVRAIFRGAPRLEGDGRMARLGASTKNDFRFLRLWHETELNAYPWVLFAKGGAHSPFYADIYLQVWWEASAREIEAELLKKYPYLGSNADFVLHRELPYLRPGLTWPLRTTSGLSVRAMPTGCIFGHKGPAALAEGDDPTELLALLAITNSRAFSALVELQLAAADAAARSYEVGVIQNTPVPHVDSERRDRLARLARRAWLLKYGLDTRTETSHAFVLPALLQTQGETLADRARAWTERVTETERVLAEIQGEIDDLCFALYGLSEEDRRRIEHGFAAGASGEAEDGSEDDEPDEANGQDEGADPGPLVASLLSWAAGVAFGRFDVRLATGEREAPPEPEPFDPLPAYSPGMLRGGEGLAATRTLNGYPSDVPGDSILVEDEGHAADFRSAIGRVFEVVFGAQGSDRLREAAELVDAGADSVRPYLAASFFEGHAKRYTKSRRKAPIYWQLATPSASYSVWLYYQRFTRDTLYRVLHDYVAPKLEHEERKLTSLRQDAGLDSPPSQRKEIEGQETFIAELRAFRDEVARVAPLWNPNLNDGVIINFAPLWRLVPQNRSWQRECLKVWEKLIAGDYDWAHLAMHLWPERVVPKCAEDRSLAIAHGLEEVFWEENGDGRWQVRSVPGERVQSLIAERTSGAVKAALTDLLSAPKHAAGGPRGRGGARSRRASATRLSTSAASSRSVSSSRKRPTAAVDPATLDAVKEAIGSASGGASKSDVLEATGIADRLWNTAIGELLSRGAVVRTGAKRGTRYHLAGTRGDT